VDELSWPLWSAVVAGEPTEGKKNPGPDALVSLVITAIEYAIVASLLLVAGMVLLRTVVTFLSHWSAFPQTVVAAIDMRAAVRT
jgi:hypothetical protein